MSGKRTMRESSREKLQRARQRPTVMGIMGGTLSNYMKNAQKYLETTPIIRGINATELVELILKYYDNLSVKYKKDDSIEDGLYSDIEVGVKC